MRIITDSGSLISIDEAKKLNISLLPLQVEINGKNFRDYFEITTEAFVEMIKNAVPNSSQPAIGEVMVEYEKPEEALHIAMTKGLSSTYNSAVGILNQMNVKHITLFNSRTLAGTQKYLVELAVRLSSKHTIAEIVERMEKCVSECQSYLIPTDFNFLKRNGRLSPMAATLSGFLHIKPIVTQTEGSEKLEKFGVARTWSMAADQIVEFMIKRGVSAKHKIYVSHALNQEVANLMIQKIKAKISSIDVECLSLTPVMITQGGPGCVAIQYILRDDAE